MCKLINSRVACKTNSEIHSAFSDRQTISAYVCKSEAKKCS